jgi:hypothetical protein
MLASILAASQAQQPQPSQTDLQQPREGGDVPGALPVERREEGREHDHVRLAVRMAAQLILGRGWLHRGVVVWRRQGMQAGRLSRLSSWQPPIRSPL